MLHGRWAPKRNVSERRKREMEEYLFQTRGEYRIPRSLQRADGKCGDLPYDGVPLFRHMWLRALCNPNGATPCCYDLRCTNRSVENCRCPHCLDPRTPVHAELSDWLPARPECLPREFYANEACELLNGTRLVLAGDSFVRHLFVALVMLLTDDFQDGALRKDANPAIRSVCQGMYQINGVRCREILDENRSLCHGSVHLTYLEVFQVTKGRFLLPYLQTESSRHQNLLLLLGVGIHDDFRDDLIWPGFVRPLAEYLTNSSIPSPAKSAENFTAKASLLSPAKVAENLAAKSSVLSGKTADNDAAKSSVLSARTAASSDVNVVKSLTASSSAKHQFTATKSLTSATAQPNQAPASNKDVASGRKLFHSTFSLRKRKWPKMIWVNTHAPGLLKSPLFPAQSYEGVKYFNSKMADILEPYGIPVLDTFNMTAPLHSVDGTHYGYGANHLKVQFLLNWVKERQDREEW
ncbi:hypothetical protein ACOMHN_061365 [Nucella lapillus]